MPTHLISTPATSMLAATTKRGRGKVSSGTSPRKKLKTATHAASKKAIQSPLRASTPSPASKPNEKNRRRNGQPSTDIVFRPIKKKEDRHYNFPTKDSSIYRTFASPSSAKSIAGSQQEPYQHHQHQTHSFREFMQPAASALKQPPTKESNRKQTKKLVFSNVCKGVSSLELQKYISRHLQACGSQHRLPKSRSLYRLQIHFRLLSTAYVIFPNPEMAKLCLDCIANQTRRKFDATLELRRGVIPDVAPFYDKQLPEQEPDVQKFHDKRTSKYYFDEKKCGNTSTPLSTVASPENTAMSRKRKADSDPSPKYITSPDDESRGKVSPVPSSRDTIIDHVVLKNTVVMQQPSEVSTQNGSVDSSQQDDGSSSADTRRNRVDPSLQRRIGELEDDNSHLRRAAEKLKATISQLREEKSELHQRVAELENKVEEAQTLLDMQDGFVAASSRNVIISVD